MTSKICLPAPFAPLPPYTLGNRNRQLGVGLGWVGAGWLACLLASWLAGWLVGWLAGRVGGSGGGVGRFAGFGECDGVERGSANF
jgi:hypothetical protein